MNRKKWCVVYWKPVVGDSQLKRMFAVYFFNKSYALKVRRRYLQLGYDVEEVEEVEEVEV